MRKRHCEGHYHGVKTTQELRRSYKLNRENEDSDESRLVRGKRRKGYLPNSWDDKRHGSYDLRKSWKEKRTKQYYGRSKLQEFVVEVPRNVDVTYCRWTRDTEQDYLERMGIPFRVSRVYENWIEVRTKRWDRIPTGKMIPVYDYRGRTNTDGTKRVMYWHEEYISGWFDCKPYEVLHSSLIKETITYWAEKEVVFV